MASPDYPAQDAPAASLRLKVLGATVATAAGTGDVTRYIGRYSSARVLGVVMVSTISPLPLQTPNHPDGVSLSAFDDIRTAVASDRAQFYRDRGDGRSFGANRPGSNVSNGIRDAAWCWCMQSGLRASYENVTAFSETDFVRDLARFDVPTLIVHGDDDQSVPVSNARRSAALIRSAKRMAYGGTPHGTTCWPLPSG